MHKVWWLVVATGCELPPLQDSADATDAAGTTLREFSGTCATSQRFEANATIAGVPLGRAILDLWDSGVTNGWNEEHSLALGAVSTEPIEATGAADTGPPGSRTLTPLSTALTNTFTQADVGDSAPGVGRTWLSCEQNAVFDLGLVTYALRAYDAEGELALCAAFGHDPQSVPDGIYSVVGGVPSNDRELATCVVGTF